jgi:hypothetical protein
MTKARQKLTQISVARQQLENAKRALAEAPSSEVGGPVAGGLSTIGVFKGGQSFQAAIDGMRGSITSITRVPGVGAMSDYETRLDQSKFPNFWMDRESTMDQKLGQLEELLNGMEAGYSEISGTEAAEPASPVPAPADSGGGWPVAPQAAIDALKRDPSLAAQYVEKYGRLPPGFRAR